MLLVALHGILTGQSGPSWPDHLDAWFYRQNGGANVHVLKKEYLAGPFPRWNLWVKNRRLARALTLELELFLAHHHTHVDRRVWLVAHSNGADIALRVASQLIRGGHVIAGLILIGAACSADVRRNGVERWLLTGQLGVAVAFCSRHDRVLPGRAAPSAGIVTRCRALAWRCMAWPYGALGTSGWTLKGQPFPPTDRIRTHWFAFGHAGYFAGDQRELTFRMILEEIERE